MQTHRLGAAGEPVLFSVTSCSQQLDRSCHTTTQTLRSNAPGGHHERGAVWEIAASEVVAGTGPFPIDTTINQASTHRVVVNAIDRSLENFG